MIDDHGSVGHDCVDSGCYEEPLKAALPKAFTQDNVEVVEGLRVFTSDCVWGTVKVVNYDVQPFSPALGESERAWHLVELDDSNGGTRMYNRSRLASRDFLSYKPDPKDVSGKR